MIGAHEVIAVSLSLALLTADAGGVRKKGGLDPQALWESADQVIGGEIRSIEAARSPYLTATLHTVVRYRGAWPDSLPIRIYGPSESEGRCAIWLLKRASDGSYGEEYPWTRLGPESFLGWPETQRDLVLERLPHAWSETRGGARLVLIEAPHWSERVVLWAALVSAPRATVPESVLVELEVEGRGGSRKLVLRETERGKGSSAAPRVFENDPPSTPGAVIVESGAVRPTTYIARATLPGHVTLTARLRARSR